MLELAKLAKIENIEIITSMLIRLRKNRELIHYLFIYFFWVNCTLF